MIRFFTWKELTKTDTCLPNEPADINRIANIIRLAESLDYLRGYFGKPIIVTSGYRSKEVNEKVGGVKTSHHTMGLAADITAKDFEGLKKAVLANVNHYDQIIIYKNFIHISIAPQMRHQVIYNDK